VARQLRRVRLDVTVALTQVRDADLYRVGGGLQRVWERIHHPTRVGRWVARFLHPGRWALLRLEDSLLRKSLCQRIITNSALVRRQVLRDYGLPSDMVDVVYNGVDLELFSPTWRRERNAVRGELGIESDAPVMLFAANNFRRKGLSTLLRSLALLLQVLPEARLVVAGRGRVKSFARLGRRLGVEDAVRFLGHRADIHRLYAASDIFVLPTLYDPCANVCLEALASGTPVITTLDNGAAEFIRPGETGYLLADPNDHREHAPLDLALRGPRSSGKIPRKREDAAQPEATESLTRLLLHFFTRADRKVMSRSARKSMEGFTHKGHVDGLEAIVDELAKFEQVGELAVNREYAELFRQHRLDRFEAVARIQPTLSDRTKRGRRLARFELMGPDGSTQKFHLKAHQLRLRDVLRPLLSLARPVTANAAVEWWGMRKLPHFGVPTATPVAFGSQRRWGLEWQGLTVSADLAGCLSLEHFLERRIGRAGERPAAERTFIRNLTRELARVARTLHHAGVNHQDFYLGHFFISAEQPLEGQLQLFLVDLQRVQRRTRVPNRYVTKDLGQLLFSAQQFPQFSRTDALRFLRLYRKEERLSDASKRLAQAITRKATAIARHTSRGR
jgi:UDP-glucose:(heptosyl)LPS alpha-1,3-glucosyltransferase